jgi:hypothetical protein
MARSSAIKRSPTEQLRVVLCGSMSVYPRILEEQHALRERGVRTLVPVAEDNIASGLSQEAFEAFKRQVGRQYLTKIRDVRTVAVLAVNCDRYNISDYIGPNTFAEIAVAFAQGKQIYLLQAIPEMYRDELQSWGAVPLHGRLDALVEAYHSYCKKAESQVRQLTFFQ